jgi:hypothetical protein
MDFSPGLVSRKTQRTLGAAVNEATADMSCDFGRRMLAKFGWQEGKGLGKKEDGMQSHIVVKQRSEYLGLGAVTVAASTAWAPPADLPGPPPESLKPKKLKKSKKDGDAAVNGFGVKPVGSGIIPGLDDSAIFQLCGGARLGRRAHPGLQVGKERRVQDADAEFMAKYGQKSAGTAVAAASGAAASGAGAAEAAVAVSGSASMCVRAVSVEAVHMVASFPAAEKSRKREKKERKRDCDGVSKKRESGGAEVAGRVGAVEKVGKKERKAKKERKRSRERSVAVLSPKTIPA